MSNFGFKPMENADKLPSVPFIEDARADYAPFYTTKKSPDDVKVEIIAELAKLGGYATYFVQGIFEGDNKRKRHGYEVHFTHNGAPGMFRVAGLPMRMEDASKRNRVLAQALCIVREWVKGMVTTKMFMPGTEPLAQYLLVDKEGHTVTDYILNAGKLPQLVAPTPDGDVIDVKVEVVG